MPETTVLRDARSMRAWAQAARAAGQRIVLVPTMGCLHDGHLSLVDVAKRHGDLVVVSIFVNPTQFGPNEDLAAYPRSLAHDLERLRAAGVDAVFTPTETDVYPPGFDTYVVPQQIATGLCGATRPIHFRGVCTVVLLLFRMTACHAAVFGEKDYQQLQVIRRMTADLWLDVEIVGAPILREPDGLAMSSRNAYLTPGERRQAIALSRALDAATAAFRDGERDSAALRREMEHVIAATAPEARIDYVEIVDPTTLQPIATVTDSAQCALAIYLGKARLIDNRRLAATT